MTPMQAARAAPKRARPCGRRCHFRQGRAMRRRCRARRCHRERWSLLRAHARPHLVSAGAPQWWSRLALTHGAAAGTSR